MPPGQELGVPLPSLPPRDHRQVTSSPCSSSSPAGSAFPSFCTVLRPTGSRFSRGLGLPVPWQLMIT